jgi:GTPase SAR1 family protein
MKPRKEVIKLKIAVTGSPAVGKTTLIKRLIDHNYNKQPLPTEQYEVYLHCLTAKTADL